ncbi:MULTISPECIES: DUF3180 family protein [Micrococcaceae]|uniref:DUF3180 family protein n=1 Tax=Micrococcaceae TaxID=1268 RepID=UPI0008CA949E|nr:DUF3180 family protein [Arthrobacter sp. HMSC08H08]MCG7305064.1 DUF3180 family protein [Pseudoglutamicibacter albus]OFT23104.1 hypothetical protein HMPREF3175_06665 [Arthrobacter sp. HMSC08H08]
MIKLRVVPMLGGWLVFAALGLLTSTLLAVVSADLWAMGRASSVALVAVAVVALVLGLWVFLSRTRRTDRRIDPLAAVRVVVFAQASALVGLAASGFHAGVVIDVVVNGVVGSPIFFRALLAAAAGVIVAAVGLVVQRLCTVDSDDDDDAAPTEGAADAAQ